MLLRLGQNTYNLLLMPRCSSFLVVIVLLIASVSPVRALTPHARFGKIKVRVVDIMNARIVGAQVTIVGEGLRWRIMTNSEGELETSLPAGAYQLSVEANGFRPAASEKLQIKSGKTQRLNIQVQVMKAIMPVPAVSDPLI